MRWDTQQHMNMVWTSFRFYDLYTFLFTQFLKISPISLFNLP